MEVYLNLHLFLYLTFILEGLVLFGIKIKVKRFDSKFQEPETYQKGILMSETQSQLEISLTKFETLKFLAI